MSTVIKEPTVVAEATPTQTGAYLIYFVAGLIDVLLFFRLIFKVTGANPGSGFVSLIYSLTQFLVLPFAGIFPRATTEGAVTTAIFEPSTLVAILVYGLLAWGLVQLLQVLSREKTTE